MIERNVQKDKDILRVKEERGLGKNLEKTSRPRGNSKDKRKPKKQDTKWSLK